MTPQTMASKYSENLFFKKEWFGGYYFRCGNTLDSSELCAVFKRKKARGVTGVEYTMKTHFGEYLIVLKNVMHKSLLKRAPVMFSGNYYSLGNEELGSIEIKVDPDDSERNSMMELRDSRGDCLLRAVRERSEGDLSDVMVKLNESIDLLRIFQPQPPPTFLESCRIFKNDFMKIGEILNDYPDEKSSSVVTAAISVLIFEYCFMGFRYIQKQDTTQ